MVYTYVMRGTVGMVGPRLIRGRGERLFRASVKNSKFSLHEKILVICRSLKILFPSVPPP